MAEKLDSVGSGLVLVPDTVGRGDEYSIGNCVCPLRGSPRLELRVAELRLLIGMPADCGGIEQDLRTEEGVNARCLGIPLVPADQDADVRVPRFPDAKSMRPFMISVVLDVRVARREIILLVEQGIVRDVHLPVDAEERAVSVYDSG